MDETQQEVFNGDILTEILTSNRRIYEAISRFDEKLKLLNTQQDGFNSKIEFLTKEYYGIVSRLLLLESKNIANLEERLRKVESINDKQISDIDRLNHGWGSMVDYAVKIIYGIAMAYILYKLGLKD